MTLTSDPSTSIPESPLPSSAGEGRPVDAASPRRAKPAKHIPALDGVRGIAILLVLIFHFGGLFIARLHNPILERLIGAGWVGVDLFFVLSGFLITSILCEAKGTAGYFKNFYMRRVLRIFPLYYGVLIAGGVVSWFVYGRMNQDWRTVADCQGYLWIYLQNFIRIDWKAFSHFWSLAVEEHFYLVWPAMVYFLSRKNAIRFCLLLIVAAIAVRVGREFFVPPGTAEYEAVRNYREATYSWTISRTDALGIGSLLALLVSGVPSGLERYRKAAPWVLLGSLIVIAGIFAWQGTYSYMVSWVQTAGITANSVASAALLVIAVTASATGLVARLFGASWLRFLGKYSYGIYVFHMLIVEVVRETPGLRKLEPYVGGSVYAAGAIYLIGGTIASIGVALLSWHLYEKHFLKLKRLFEYRVTTIEGFKANERV